MHMKYKPLTDVRYLVVHCSATPPDMDIGAKEIDLWHRQRGFFEIGYHAVIRRDGSVELGRPVDKPGAHAKGWNNLSLGVCLVGGVKSLPEAEPENNFTRMQFASLADVLSAWKKDWPLAEIVGHRDLPSPHARLKACPSFDAGEWARSVGLQ